MEANQPMNSKEEILKKNLVKYYRASFPETISDDELYKTVRVFHEEEKAILSAMTEYRSIGEREAAMGFATWKEDNGYVRVNSIQLKKSAWVNAFKEKILINGSDHHYTTLIEECGFTTEQLYEIYKQSL